MNKLKLIIVREFIAKVRNRTFIVMTFLSPVLMIGMIALITLITKNSIEKTRTVSYIDQSGLFTPDDFKETKTLKFIDISNLDLETAKETIKKTDQYGLLYIPKENSIDDVAKKMQFFSNESPSLIFTENLEEKLNKRLRLIKMKELHIDIEKVNESKIKSDIQLSNFEGKESSKFKNELKLGIGSAAGYMIMMFIIIYGAMVMRSVIEEKTSRIIEVIVSSVKPFQLMLGKVIGTAGAGIFQFIIWGIVAVLLYTLLLPVLGVNTGTQVNAEQMQMIKEVAENSKIELIIQEIKELPILTILISFILYFIGGFLLYSSLYAAIGAAVDNETDTQQFMLPVIMPLMLGIYIGFAVVINDPNGTLATTFSMIPFTSPIVMMMRIPLGVPLWQIIVSLVLLLLTFIGMIWFAAKIYRVGILMYGKKPGYKELYKWLKY
jgi:ABC-2 type transport system permease protein